MGPMLFNWQNKCTEQVGENDFSTKNATRRSTQPRQMPGYHETLRQMPGSVHHTESILLGMAGNVKNNCIKTGAYDKKLHLLGKVKKRPAKRTSYGL